LAVSSEPVLAERTVFLFLERGTGLHAANPSCPLLPMKENLKKHLRLIRLSVLAVLLVLITVIHYLVGARGAGLLHSILGHLYIIPILLGASWYGVLADHASILPTALPSHLFPH
jgi:hypothetical protein